MKWKGIIILLVALVGLAVLAHDGYADGREPAACLLYPFFNTHHGNFAVITVTNTCAETVDLRIVFISTYNDCEPKDYWRTLTGYDTFTFVDRGLNKKIQKGFCYIYVVKNYGSKLEKAANCLIGQEFVFGSWTGDVGSLVNYGVNAVPFAAVGTVNEDGKLKLDGLEYDPAPSAIMFPRFFGQDPPAFHSRVILINLTGGKYFWANLGINTWDDSEHPSSDFIYVPCFWMGTLFELTPDVTEGYLLGSSTDLDELYDGTFVMPKKQTGWLEIYGVNAHYLINQIDNPGIYGLLIERVGRGFAADLPWEVYDPVNQAMLWSTSTDGT